MNKQSKAMRGKAISVKKILAYQDKAILSKELIKEASGTLTLFAFDKNEGLSEHTAPFDATIFVLEGAVKVFISGKSQILRANQMIIMPAHKPHSLKAITRLKMFLILIRK